MHRPCPHPWCREGRVVSRPLRVLACRSLRKYLPGVCPVCQGTGFIDDRDERDEDLRSAGIVLEDTTEEDFRSSPLHWSP